MPWIEGDGLTPTNLNNKLPSGLAFNVKDAAYGAVGDGVTDDTAAIQAAIDACEAAGGGTVFFPNGVFRVSGLTLPGYVTLKGVGGWQGGSSLASTIRLISGSNANIVTVEAGARQWCVRDIELRGDSANQGGTSNGVYVNTSGSFFSDGLIENVAIQDCLTSGVYVVSGIKTVLVSKCLVQDSGADGVYIAGSDCKVLDSLVGYSGGYGVNIVNVANLVQGCDIYFNLVGIHLSSARNSLVNNKLNQNERQAVLIDGFDNIVAANSFDANCTEANGAYATIRVADSRGVDAIVGNTFSNTEAETNLPSYHIELSSGTYTIAAIGNSATTTSSVSGFASDPTRLNNGDATALVGYTVLPDTDAARSLGSTSLGWRDMVVRHTGSVARGILLDQTDGVTTTSPRLYFGAGGSVSTWAMRNTGGAVSFAADGVYGSSTGTEYFQVAKTGIFPASAISLDLGNASRPWGTGTIDYLRLSATSTPAPTASGSTGQLTWDTSYLYLCTSANSWRRVALAGY